MEFVDGHSICHYAKEHDLALRDRVEPVLGLCRAVQHAHEQGVLHRDLKPDNVLVRSDGTPCVLDFGVVHMASNDADDLTLTVTGQVIGTLAYMAPEQARGANLDDRADQFALGAILYELITGELPFDVRGRLPHESLRIIANAECRAPTQFISSLPGDLEAIPLTTLAAEPVQRYADVKPFAMDLERYLAGKPVHARPRSSLRSLVRFVRRHAMLSAVLLLSLFPMGAIFSWGIKSLLAAERAEGG